MARARGFGQGDPMALRRVAVVMALTLLAAPAESAPTTSDETPPPETAAGAPPLTWGSEIDVNRRYVYLGMPFSSGVVVQPSAWVGRGPFTLTWWGSVNGAPRQEHHLAEMDVIGTWTGAVGEVALTVTLDTYLWRTPSSTFVNGILYVKGSVPAGPLRAFVLQLLDLRRYRGSYHVAGGLSWQRTFGRATVAAQASTGWAEGRFNRFYLGAHESGWLESALDVGVTWQVGKRAYVRPHLLVTTLLDRDFRHAYGEATLVTPGLAVGWQ